MIKYYTKAWQDECIRRMNADPTFAQEAKKLNGTFVFRIYDGPDKQDRTMHWTFKQGQLVDHKYEAQPAPWQELRNSPFPPAWVMRGSCPYDMMGALNRGDITPMRALASPHYKLEGNKMSIMQLMKPLSLWNGICSSVECVYDWQTEDAVETNAEATGDITNTEPAPATQEADANVDSVSAPSESSETVATTAQSE